LRAALACPVEPSAIPERNFKAALERVELGHLSDSLDREMQWGLKLSKDEQVRVAVARLLLHRPVWIFAEHVFGALADEHCELIRSIFETELAQSAVVSIGHRAQCDNLCRKVIHLTSSSAA
jgi:putative ATP-binding cassette transporter